MKLAITGHRPEEFNVYESGYDEAKIVKRRLPEVFQQKLPDVVICGMASGVDLWAGCAALDLRIPVISAKPWAGHKARQADVEAYERIVNEAIQVVNVTDYDSYPGPWVYQVRNEWMVDRADEVLCVWKSPKKTGGTWNCIKYALGNDKPVWNLNQFGSCYLLPKWVLDA